MSDAQTERNRGALFKFSGCMAPILPFPGLSSLAYAASGAGGRLSAVQPMRLCGQA